MMAKSTPKDCRKTIWINQGFMPMQIGFCPSEHAFKKIMHKYKIEDTWEGEKPRSAVVKEFVSDKGNAFILVCLQQDDDAHSTYLTLVHEAVHVWQKVCSRMGERRPGEEVEAYSVEFIVSGLVKAYVKTLGKGKHKKGWGK